VDWHEVFSDAAPLYIVPAAARVGFRMEDGWMGNAWMVLFYDERYDGITSWVEGGFHRGGRRRAAHSQSADTGPGASSRYLRPSHTGERGGSTLRLSVNFCRRETGCTTVLFVGVSIATFAKT